MSRSTGPACLPPTSLIICSRNRPRMLLETVESVLQGTDLPAELIVIDQSAERHPVLSGLVTDARCRLRYIWSESVGLSRARNLGLTAASHPIVAFTDDDMLVAVDWYGVLIRALVVAGQRTVTTGRVLAGPPEAPGTFVPALVTGDQPRSSEGRIGTDVLAGCQFAMYRTMFEAVGPFDERLGVGAHFPAAEDNDLGFRLLEAGYRTTYTPLAVVYHRAWRAANAYLPKRWDYGRGQGGFYAKFASWRDRYVLERACRDVGLHLLRFPWRFLHAPRLAVGDLAYALGIVAGAAEWRMTYRSVAGQG
jgi:GT2 family glycosyltransferase